MTSKQSEASGPTSAQAKVSGGKIATTAVAPLRVHGQSAANLLQAVNSKPSAQGTSATGAADSSGESTPLTAATPVGAGKKD